MQNEAPPESTERYESIPWDRLLAPERRRRPWLVAGTVTALAVVMVVVVGRRLPESTPVLPPVATAAVDPSIPVTAPQTPAVTSAPVYSEADLMALDPAVRDRSAAARAEWFAAEYFTITAGKRSDALAVLGLPATDPGLGSFVESARALDVRWTSATEASVTVLVRRLVDGPGGSVRVPAVTVEVDVEMAGPDVVVTGIPRIAGMPGLAVRAPAGVPVELSEIQVQEVVGELAAVGAVDAASVTGRRLPTGGTEATALVTDPAGMMWRLAVALSG